MGSHSHERLLISNEKTNRLVHTWRSEEAGILVGTNTAAKDDPQLNTRLVPGPSPVRMVLDINLRLPEHLKIFDGSQKTIVFNEQKNEEQGQIIYRKINSMQLVEDILHSCYKEKLLSIIVEGGAQLLETFIRSGSWDEARVITNTKMFAENGIKSPSLPLIVQREFMVEQDKVQIFENIK